MNPMRGSGKDASDEIAQITEADMADYITLVQNQALRLEMVQGCTAIDYTPPEDQPGSGDFSCYMFHPSGGAVPYRDFGAAGCAVPLTSLNVGQQCGSLIYAGTSGGNRIYAYETDLATNYTWNNGNSTKVTTGVTSASDGLTNTNSLLILNNSNSPFEATAACRTLGADWYLPAKDELDLLATVRTTGSFNGTFTSNVYYWSSTEVTFHSSYIRIVNGGNNNGSKDSPFKVRCIRRD